MSKQIILSENAPSPIGPYSQAVMVGNMLYVSGQIALNRAGKLLTGDITKETQQVMKNIEAILVSAGMDFSHVVKCTIFIRNMAEFSTINHAYGEFFGNNPPARETVEVSRLPKDANVEISCIAAK